VSDVTLTPETFTLVKFDADEVRDLIRQTIAAVDFPADVDVTVEVDEVLPHPLTASAVDVSEGAANLWFTGGCFESPQRQTGLSVENTRVELGSALLRAKDRLVGGFADAPADIDLDDRQRTLWEAYAEGRLVAMDFPVRVQRRRYTFRLYGGFNDLADAAFERLWSGEPIDWAGLDAISQDLAAADTRPERKKSLRKESLRVAAPS
jgi:hypothetical protein